MRKPYALSPTGLRLWRKNREQFFLQNLATTRAPRQPQAQFMSLGSAFDAYAKSSLHCDLNGRDPQFEFETIFETQVEAPHRDWAREHGKHVFNSYVCSGSYAKLLDLLEKSSKPPRFEFSVTRVIDGIPFTGRPDCWFWIGDFAVVLDWKVKGYLSSASPSQYYVVCLDGYESLKQSRSHGKPHKLARVIDWNGIQIHDGSLSDSSQDYGDQLAIYSWLEGATPGDENVLCWIDELVSNKKREIRIATHRAKASREHQLALLAQAKECWAAIQSGHIFACSREDSDARCAVLDDLAKHLHIEKATYA